VGGRGRKVGGRPGGFCPPPPGGFGRGVGGRPPGGFWPPPTTGLPLFCGGFGLGFAAGGVFIAPGPCCATTTGWDDPSSAAGAIAVAAKAIVTSADANRSLII
jgi:hypothetical protein